MSDGRGIDRQYTCSRVACVGTVTINLVAGWTVPVFVLCSACESDGYVMDGATLCRRTAVRLPDRVEATRPVARGRR